MNIVIDNFFKDPDKIREYALSLNYDLKGSNYPGVRANIPEPLKQQIIEKVLSLFFNFNKEYVEWDIHLSFQKVNKGHKGGWIHQDNGIFTAVIYLSPDSKENEGTFLYEPLMKEKDFIYEDDIRFNSFTNDFSSEEENKQRLLFNSQFKTQLEVKNKYNRLFIFPGGAWHGVPEYNSDRLTLIMFVEDLKCNSLPLQRVNSYSI